MFASVLPAVLRFPGHHSAQGRMAHLLSFRGTTHGHRTVTAPDAFRLLLSDLAAHRAVEIDVLDEPEPTANVDQAGLDG